MEEPHQKRDVQSVQESVTILIIAIHEINSKINNVNIAKNVDIHHAPVDLNQRALMNQPNPRKDLLHIYQPQINTNHLFRAQLIHS